MQSSAVPPSAFAWCNLRRVADMRTPVVLGIDPGLNMGWGVLRPSRTPEYGTIRVAAPAEGKTAERRQWRTGYRQASILTSLGQLIDDVRPGVVVYEAVPFHRSFKSHHAALSYVQVLVGVEQLCAEREIDVCAVAASAAKKWATGSGRAGEARYGVCRLREMGHGFCCGGQ